MDGEIGKPGKNIRQDGGMLGKAELSECQMWMFQSAWMQRKENWILWNEWMLVVYCQCGVERCWEEKKTEGMVRVYVSMSMVRRDMLSVYGQKGTHSTMNGSGERKNKQLT